MSEHELGGADGVERLDAHLSEEFVEANPQARDPLDDSYGAQDLITTAEEAKQPGQRPARRPRPAA